MYHPEMVAGKMLQLFTFDSTIYIAVLGHSPHGEYTTQSVLYTCSI